MSSLILPRPMTPGPRPDHLPPHVWHGLTEGQRLALGPDGGSSAWDRLPLLGRLFVGAWIGFLMLCVVALVGAMVYKEIVYGDYDVYPFPERACAVRHGTPRDQVHAVIHECLQTGVFAPQKNRQAAPTAE